jgi:hypothetical protein
MNTSEDKTWNTAAAVVVNMMFNIYMYEYSDSKSGLARIRDTYSAIFSNFYQKPEAVAGAELSFINLGAIALAAASKEFSDFYNEDETVAVLCKKQADYGPENISKFGRDGILVRMHDKIARLENLSKSGQSPNNESIKDNYLDVLGYAAVGALWESGDFFLPLTVVESNQDSPSPEAER